MTHRRSGFTLVELLVYLGVSMIVVLVISKFMVDVSAAATRNRQSLELQAQSRFVMSRLSQHIRTASAVTQPNAQTVQLTDADGLTTYRYTLDGQQLTESINGGAPGSLTGPEVAVQAFSVTAQSNGLRIFLELIPAQPGPRLVPPHAVSTTLIPRQEIYQ